MFELTLDDSDIFEQSRKVFRNLGKYIPLNYPVEFKSSNLRNGSKYVYFGDVCKINEDREGNGMCILSSGCIYEGSWKNDMRHGNGRYIFSDRDYYIGGWKDDKMHGNGSYYYADGRTYVGEYYNGKKEGRGVEYDSNGKIFKKGRWRENRFDG